MLTRYPLKTIGFFAAIGVCTTAIAQAPVSNVDIPVIDRPPLLEDFTGMAPSAEIRDKMALITDFVQRVPDDGEPASHRTEAYLAYDDRNIYAVFLAFDEQPELVRANLSPRENVQDDDTVSILIDTFNDQRTGYAFRSTPLGVQWDGRWNEAGEGGGGNFDSSYQAVWYTDAELTESGYIVLMTVPIRTLRFPETGEQVWRVMLERRIPRLSEQSFWPAYSNSIAGRLNQAASLTGIRDVEPGRNIQLIPFAFVRDFDVLDANSAGGPSFRRDTEDEFGIDAKFVLNDSFVLDATYNPDFSQVESNEPQITVNQRFEVRFDELRPFFLENSDFFATESTLLFTRRIVDPEAGIRLTGKHGDWGVGTMLMNDEAPGLGRAPGDPLSGEAADVRVVRLFREISDQSRVGLFYSERDFGSASNDVTSIDGHIVLTNNWSSDFQFVDTDTRRLSGETLSGSQNNFRIDRRGRDVTMHIHAIDTSPGFRTDLGFLSRNYRPDTAGYHTNLSYSFWPESSELIRWTPRIAMIHNEDQNGLRIYSQWSPRVQWEWDGDTELEIEYSTQKERLRPQDFAGLPFNRDYESEVLTASFETQSSPKIGYGIEFETGTAINLDPADGMFPELADYRAAELELLWRPIDRLRVDTSYLHAQLDDRMGAGRIFTNDIIRSRWNYQFTKELSLRFIFQQEETDAGIMTSLEDERNRNYDLLVRYVINPWSALYVGYNSNSSNFDIVETEDGDTELIMTNGLRRDGEQFFIKFSYLLQP